MTIHLKGIIHNRPASIIFLHRLVSQLINYVLNPAFFSIHENLDTQFIRFLAQAIYLPRHPEALAEPTGKESAAAVTGNETILLVEDEPAILEMTGMMLHRLGYTVLSAGKPAEAIELARNHTGEIHLLITDVVMPEMNGRDLAQSIASLHPNIRKLFMSGYPADVIARQGVLDEGVLFIQKPFLMKDLAAKLREAIGNH